MICAASLQNTHTQCLHGDLKYFGPPGLCSAWATETSEKAKLNQHEITYRFTLSVPRCRFKIYTRTGDKGEASLFNGQRASKNAEVFAALGDVDELNSSVGVAKEYCRAGAHNALVEQVSAACTHAGACRLHYAAICGADLDLGARSARLAHAEQSLALRGAKRAPVRSREGCTYIFCSCSQVMAYVWRGSAVCGCMPGSELRCGHAAAGGGRHTAP